MACFVPHTDDEIQALVQKLIDEDMVRQKAILDLALQFDNACTAKDDLRKAYAKCNDIPQKSRALIDTFLKEGSDKDYELNLSMYGKAAKIKKQTNAKLELSLDIDDSDLRLTPVLTPCSSTRVETSTPTQKPDGAVMSTQEYTKKVVEDVGEDEDFKSGSWVSVTDHENANGGIVSGCLGGIKNFLKNRKLDQVVAIVKSFSSNMIGDLTVTMKDLSSTIPGTIHHKVVDEGGYGKDFTVGATLILANVLVFTPKPSIHYLNITIRNVVKVFRKDTVPGSGSG
ncbi:ribonuclease H-like domain-containing protein [Tanacetum coccineum]